MLERRGYENMIFKIFKIFKVIETECTGHHMYWYLKNKYM